MSLITYRREFEPVRLILNKWGTCNSVRCHAYLSGASGQDEAAELCKHVKLGVPSGMYVLVMHTLE